MLVPALAVLHARLKEAGQHRQLPGLGDRKVLAVPQGNVPVAVLGVVGQLVIVLLGLLVPVVQSVEQGCQGRAGGQVGDYPPPYHLGPLPSGGVAAGDPPAELVQTLHAGVEEGNHSISLSGQLPAPAEVHRDVHRLVECLLRVHARLPHQLVGSVAGAGFHRVAHKGDPVQRVGAELFPAQALPGLLGKIPVGGVCAGVAAAHRQKFLVHGVGVLSLDFVHVGAAHRREYLGRVPHLGVNEKRAQIPGEVGEQRPDDVVPRDVAGHEPADFPIGGKDAFQSKSVHVGQALQQKGIIDLPELLVATLQNGDHVVVGLASAVLAEHVVQTADDPLGLLLAVPLHAALLDPVRQLGLYPGHVKALPHHRRGNLLQKAGVDPQPLRLIGDPAHHVVADTGVHHLHDVGHDVVHRVNDVQPAAVCLLDGAGLVGKAPLGPLAPALRAHCPVEGHVVLPAIRPILGGLGRHQAGAHAPGLQKFLLEFIQPLGDFLELRVLRFQLCL